MYLMAENKYFTMSGVEYTDGFTLANANGEAMFNLNGALHMRIHLSYDGTWTYDSYGFADGVFQ